MRPTRRSASCSCRPKSCAHEKAILCTRRPRSKDEQMPWLLHLMTVHDVERYEVSFETDRARFIGRGNTRAAAAGAAGQRAAEWRPRLGARPDRGDPLRDHARTRPGCDGRHRHRHGRTARSGAAPDRQIPGPPPGRPRVRTGLDAQPGGAAPAERQRSGRAAVRAPGQRRDLSECGPARRSQHPDQEPARPVRPVGVCHFRRPADRAAADHATRPTSSWRARWCRRTPTGA